MQARTFERLFVSERNFVVRCVFFAIALAMIWFVGKNIWLDNRIINTNNLRDIPVVGSFFPNVSVKEVRYVRHHWSLFYRIDASMRGTREQFAIMIKAIDPFEIGKARLPGPIGSFPASTADFPTIPDGVEIEYAIGSVGNSSRQILVVVFVPGNGENAMGAIYLKCY